MEDSALEMQLLTTQAHLRRLLKMVQARYEPTQCPNIRRACGELRNAQDLINNACKLVDTNDRILSSMIARTNRPAEAGQA